MDKIRLSKSCVGPEEQDAVSRVLQAGYLGMGEETRLFEEEICSFIGGGREVVSVATGTSALHLALSCLGIGPGDEVLLPTLTYVASFQAISATGATPIACDVHERNALVNLRDAKMRVSTRARAIMPVHYASNPASIEETYSFAAEHGLRVIEDAAQSFGCTYNENRVGRHGDIVCFSFDGIKNITCGEGGAVVTGDIELAARMRDARLLGVEKDTDARFSKARSWDFDVRHQGFRYHLSNIMAAIGRAQLRKFDRFATARINLAQEYVKKLSQFPFIKLLDIEYGPVVPHIFPIRVSNGKREAVRRLFQERNIEWGYHYKPNHLLTLYTQAAGPLPVSERLAEELLTLPLHPDLTSEMQDLVVNTLKQALFSN